MRHRKRGKFPGTSSAHRRSNARNMSISLIRHGSVRTTLAKAKALRPIIEPLITRAKKAECAEINCERVHHIRVLRSKLGGGDDLSDILRVLVNVLGRVFAERPGGYTQIFKLGNRSSDGAPMALIRFVIDEKSVSRILPNFSRDRVSLYAELRAALEKTPIRLPRIAKDHFVYPPNVSVECHGRGVRRKCEIYLRPNADSQPRKRIEDIYSVFLSSDSGCFNLEDVSLSASDGAKIIRDSSAGACSIDIAVPRLTSGKKIKIASLDFNCSRAGEFLSITVFNSYKQAARKFVNLSN